MQFIRNLSPLWRVFIIISVWLAFISALHYWFNLRDFHPQCKTVKMGYMPVITNLAAPILDLATRECRQGVRFEAIKFTAFSEMAEAIRNDHIDAAFIIAPLSIVLRQQGSDVKIIYIGNRHESTMVVQKGLGVSSLRDLAGRTIAVPMRFSGHNISILQLMEKNGLAGRINVVEMNPPDMAAALSSGSLDAYYVGEPFAAQTVRNGTGQVLFRVEDVWKHFICNLVIVKQTLIEKEPDVVKKLVQGAVRSGLWAKGHPEEAARIASEYWGQPVDLVEYALTTPRNRIVYDEFLPKESEIKQLADLMVAYGFIANNSIDGLVEDRFAREANLEEVTDFSSILK